MEHNVIPITEELSDKHLRMLRDESGISLERIRNRGYRTITEEEPLEELGFADFQIRVPALFIPVMNILGELVFYRIRPDDPRLDPKKPWKVTKYEHPAGVPLTLDIPQFTLENLSDTARRLWITEGERKTDALISRGELAIGIFGVDAWKRDGLPLPEWDRVSLIGREVFLGFDSDAHRKVSIRRSLKELAEYLEGRGAR